MKKLDQFILKSFIGPFFAILMIVIFILVMQFLWLYIDELVGKGLELKVILEFLMWGSCQVLPLALPLATLLSSMMTFGDLGEHYELAAMKAAGISLTRILAPVVVASALIAVAAFFIGDRLVPYSINQIYTMRDDIGRTKSEIKIPLGTFYDGIEGYILRVDDRNDETGMMYGVMVYDHTTDKGNLRVTVADSGMMKMSKAKDYLTFQLYNGTNYQETNTKRYRDTTLALQRIHFSRQEMVIPLENYAFQHSDSRPGPLPQQRRTRPVPRLPGREVGCRRAEIPDGTEEQLRSAVAVAAGFGLEGSREEAPRPERETGKMERPAQAQAGL